jgi:hypothetical protein
MNDGFESYQDLIAQADQADADFVKHDAELQRLLAKQVRERNAPDDLVYKTVINEPRDGVYFAKGMELDPERVFDLVQRSELTDHINMVLDICGEELGKYVDDLKREAKELRERIRELEVEVRVVRGLASGTISEITPQPQKSRTPHVA